MKKGPFEKIQKEKEENIKSVNKSKSKGKGKRKSTKLKMNGKENAACARRWKNVGKRVSLKICKTLLLKICKTLLQALTVNSFRDSGSAGGGGGGVSILQGVTRIVIAFIAIASNTISVVVASDSQFSVSNENNIDLNAAIATSDTDADYSFDAIEKRIYRSSNINTSSIVASALPYANLTGGDSDNESSENVTMSNFGGISDLLFATMQNPFNAIKSNDTIDLMSAAGNLSSALTTESDVDFESTTSPMIDDQNHYWALSAIVLVVGTAAGNILVCLAIAWERRLQNVTNYFLMSLAITDLMVAILVMPLGILILVKGEYQLTFVCILTW